MAWGFFSGVNCPGHTLKFGVEGRLLRPDDINFGIIAARRLEAASRRGYLKPCARLRDGE